MQNSTEGEVTEDEVKVFIDPQTNGIANLEKLKKVESELDEALKQLEADLSEKQSYISRAANYWASLSFTERVIGGALVVVPFFLLGCLSSVTVLVTIGITNLVTYLGVWLGLDNYQLYNDNTKINFRKVKNEVKHLSGMLGGMIQELDKLRETMAHEVEKFQSENQHLHDQLKKIEEINGTLSQQSKEMSVHLLQEGDLLLQAQTQVSQLELTGQFLALQLKEAKQHESGLKRLLEQFTKELVTGEKGREEIFLKRVDDFLANKDESLGVFLEKMSNLEETTKKLQEAQEWYQKLFEKYTNLLTTHEKNAKCYDEDGEVAKRNEKIAKLNAENAKLNEENAKLNAENAKRSKVWSPSFEKTNKIQITHSKSNCSFHSRRKSASEIYSGNSQPSGVELVPSVKKY